MVQQVRPDIRQPETLQFGRNRFQRREKIGSYAMLCEQLGKKSDAVAYRKLAVGQDAIMSHSDFTQLQHCPYHTKGSQTKGLRGAR